MKRLGIFGGTFNPVHSEHINIARAAVRELDLDKLIVMPTNVPPHKKAPSASAEDRFNMLSLAFSGDDKIEVGDREIKEGGKSYTFATVEYYAQFCGELFFIVGGDMLADFKTWKNPDRILNAARLAAFTREDCNADFSAEHEYFLNTFGKDFITLSYPGGRASSTEIRVYSSLGLDITGMTADPVIDYISQKGLYKGGKCEEYVKSVLPQKRLKHTADVAVCALSRAKAEGVPEDKALTAAILHDCAKYTDKDSLKGFVLPDGVPKPVEHAFMGAFVAEHILGIDDGEIIDAIRYHTSGKAGMSKLAKLIFTADMVEKGRTYEGVEKLRTMYAQGLDKCFEECLKEEMIHLLNKKSQIYVETLNAYDYYINGKR